MRAYVSYFLKLVVCLIFCFSLASAYAADDQTGSTRKYNVILHINNPIKISLLYNSATSLQKELSNDVDIVIVFNGPAVTRLLKNDSAHTQLEELLKKGAKILACHNALIHHHVDTKLLIPGVEALNTDGNVEIVRYQYRGYEYIKI